MNVISSVLRNWIPYKLYIKEGQPFCNWLFVGEQKFTEPFFEETISKCLMIIPPGRSKKSVSSPEILPQWAPAIESIPPSAIIFHVSRCGSTLASQLIALNPNNIVLSEVPFFDELLRWRKKEHPGNDAESLELLNSAIRFYGAKRENNQDRLIIKTDSWHIFFYSYYRKLYPGTPFILLYRRPDEVIRSQQKKRGMHAVPGIIEPELFEFNINDIMDYPLDEYMAKVLEKYFEVFVDILQNDPLSFPVNYNEGAEKIVSKIAEVSGISITPGDMDKIKQRANYHAKDPKNIFSEETITDAIPAYCKPAFQLYEAIEKVRTNAASYA